MQYAFGSRRGGGALLRAAADALLAWSALPDPMTKTSAIAALMSGTRPILKPAVGYVITNPPLPLWTGAQSDGSYIAIPFNQVLDAGRVPLPSAFSVTRNGVNVPLSFVEVSGTALILTPTTPVVDSTYPFITTYIPSAIFSQRLASDVGDEVAAWAAQQVVFITAPTITAIQIVGTPQAGFTLTCPVTATSNATVTRQWTRNGAAITGATGFSFVPNPATQGWTHNDILGCTATATNSKGATPPTSVTTVFKLALIISAIATKNFADEAVVGDVFTFTAQANRPVEAADGTVTVIATLASNPAAADPAESADVTGGLPQSTTLLFANGASGVPTNYSVVDDALVETVPEGVLWTISGPTNAALGVATATGTIGSDDIASTLPPPLPDANTQPVWGSDLGNTYRNVVRNPTVPASLAAAWMAFSIDIKVPAAGIAVLRYFVCSGSTSTARFGLQSSSPASTLRFTSAAGSFSVLNILAAVDWGKTITLHFLVNFTGQTAIVGKSVDGGAVVMFPISSNTLVSAGANMTAHFSTGINLFGPTSSLPDSTSSTIAGIRAFWLHAGTGTAPALADFSAARFLGGAAWGGNGELLLAGYGMSGLAPLYYWPMTLALASTGVVNRGSGNTWALAPLFSVQTYPFRTTANPGQLAIGDVSAPEGTGGATSFAFPVTRNNGLDGAVGVTASVVLSGAALATDFVGDVVPAPVLLAWPDKDAATKFYNVPVKPDSTIEGDKDFSVVLSAPTGGVSIFDSTGIGVIIDDDNVPPTQDQLDVQAGMAMFAYYQALGSDPATLFNSLDSIKAFLGAGLSNPAAAVVPSSSSPGWNGVRSRPAASTTLLENFDLHGYFYLQDISGACVVRNCRITPDTGAGTGHIQNGSGSPATQVLLIDHCHFVGDPSWNYVASVTSAYDTGTISRCFMDNLPADAFAARKSQRIEYCVLDRMGLAAGSHGDGWQVRGGDDHRMIGCFMRAPYNDALPAYLPGGGINNALRIISVESPINRLMAAGNLFLTGGINVCDVGVMNGYAVTEITIAFNISAGAPWRKSRWATADVYPSLATNIGGLKRNVAFIGNKDEFGNPWLHSGADVTGIWFYDAAGLSVATKSLWIALGILNPDGTPAIAVRSVAP